MKLEARPSASDFRHLMNSHGDASILEISWVDPLSEEEYLLEVSRPQRAGEEVGWILYMRSEASVIKRWQKRSNDLAQIEKNLGELTESPGSRRKSKNVTETFYALPQFKEAWADSGADSKDSSGSGSEDAIGDAIYDDKPVSVGLDTSVEPVHGVADYSAYLAASSSSLGESLQRMPVFKDRKDSLKGNLAQVEVANLVQSIRGGSLSGRLKIHRTSSYVHIFFVDGEPQHAEGSRGTGEDCLLQTLCWTSGDFEFEPRLKTSELSISTPLDKLLIQGAKLKEATSSLKNMGLHMETLLRCKRRGLSGAELDGIIAGVQSFDPELEKQIYTSLGKSVKTLHEIVEEFWLMRSTWVPVLANLFDAGLIEVFERDRNASGFEPRPVNPSILQAARERLTESSTDILTADSFLFLADFLIRNAPEVQLSLVLVGFLTAKDKALNRSPQISTEGFKMIAEEINSIPYFKGTLGHYENGQGGIGILFLDCSYKETRKMARAVLEALPPSTLELAMASVDTTQVCIGCAHYKEDADDLANLVGAAETALVEALKYGGGVVFARDL
ncbi:DUF4388 domain-containing protein [bacterium]|nr:DUF4388 domain-containing protein [bacterium]